MAEKNNKIQSLKNRQGIVSPLHKRLYTLKEAAEYLGRSVWSVRELIWAGKIPVVRGDGDRKIFLDIHDIEEYINRNKLVCQ